MIEAFEVVFRKKDGEQMHQRLTQQQPHGATDTSYKYSWSCIFKH